MYPPQCPGRPKHHLGTRTTHFGERLGNYSRVVPGQPLNDRLAGNLDAQARNPLVAQKRGAFEPGMVGVGVDFRLYPAKNIVPNS